MTPVRLGVLGCASIVRRRMLPAVARRTDVELVAVASRDETKAKSVTAEFGGEAVEGYEQLLARDDLDAVYVPLPAALHAEWVERALRAGLHVLCEKPLTGTLPASLRLVRLAEERGLSLVENFMFARHAQHAVVRELVAAGAIGEVRSLTAEFAFPPKPAGDMRYTAAGGGALVEIGGYPLRTALMLLGDDLAVAGAVVRHSAGHGVDLSGAALLTDPAGRTAHLTWGMEHAYRASYELWGETGRIVVEWAYTPPAGHRPVLRIETQDRIDRRTLPADDQFGNVLAEFARSVRTGVPGELEGRNVLRLAALFDEVAAAARVCGAVG